MCKRFVLLGCFIVLTVLLLTSGCVILEDASETAKAITPPNIDYADEFESGFIAPPDTTKPWIYWYWMNGRVSKDGLTKDLEAMNRVGIREVMIGHINDTPNDDGVEILSQDWWQLVDHAVREARRLGIDIAMFCSIGWSQTGGPWIKPEESMQYLISSETRVNGPMKFSGKLPAGHEQFTDVTVLAFEVPKGENDFIENHAPQIIFSGHNKELAKLVDAGNGNITVGEIVESDKPDLPSAKWICAFDWKLEQPFTARSLTFDFNPTGLDISGRLKALNADGTFDTIESFTSDHSVDVNSVSYRTMFLPYEPVIFAFAPTASTHFRLELDDARGIRNIKLSSAARVENAAEKQLGRLCPSPYPKWDSYLWPYPDAAEDTETAISPADVKNLSEYLGADGTLTWDVPQGQWIIKRIGMTSTGMENSPAAKVATGLECDKMSTTALEKHFNALIKKIISRYPKDVRKAFKHVVIDSWEVGGQNWTPGFEKIFEERLGYDPLPWLPVLDGQVVGSPGQSERFLWDWRRLVADLISENHIGRLKEIANRNNLKLWLENYGAWGFPGEFLQYGSLTDHVSGEFWTSGPLGTFEMRDASSCAHTYGKNIISAEAFTSILDPSLHPFSVKPRGDWAFTEGINHFVLHVYAHQSKDLAPVGMNPWFGTPFHRNNPWFLQMRSWVRYLQRCHYMLQHGQHVADVAYFIGEDTPKMNGVRQQPLPAGYNYDYINGDVIRDHMTIKDGRWTLPDGMSYQILALPALETMRPELLKRIRNLVKKGGAIIGQPPKRSPSLQGYPDCDAAVARLAGEIWGDCDGVNVKQRKSGKGMVFNGIELQSALDTLKVEPEIVIEQPGVLWTHRADKDSDIYFVTNQNSHAVLANMSFRVSNRTPELWDPASGEAIRTARFERDGTRTRLTVPMDAAESIFVVFRKRYKGKTVVSLKLGDREISPAQAIIFRDAKKKLQARVTQPGRYTVKFSDNSSVNFNVKALPDTISVDGSWDVTFPLADGSISEKVSTLIPWGQHSNEGIKTFTGTATYRKSFTIPIDYFAKNRRIILNLGNVGVMAGVTINQKQFETLWKPPFELDITDTAKLGENILEIKVTNAHGDKSSGLMGPVTVSTVAVVQLVEQ